MTRPRYAKQTRLRRCGWVSDNELYRDYHGNERGVPCFDDRPLFEFLTLEGAQAGLSWITILRTRDHYRRLFGGFDIERIARYHRRKVATPLNAPGIVRNRLKLESTIVNARLCLEFRGNHRSFSDFVWRYVDNRPIQNRWSSRKVVPASTDRSDIMSRDQKKLGFKFVGTTICYAFMQAVGMVNGHRVDCLRHRPVAELAATL